MGIIRIMDNKKEKFGQYTYGNITDAQAAIDEIVNVCIENNISYDYDIADIPIAGMTWDEYQNYLNGDFESLYKLKLEKANSNIIGLIDDIICYHESKIRGTCDIDLSLCPKDNNGLELSCDRCKEMRLEQMRDELIRQNVVD